MDAGRIKEQVREYYGGVARGATGCGCKCERAGPQPAGAAGPSLGCGSPVPHADLRPGQVVVDLGSGAGLDVLRAASRVGPEGRAVGVDMTPEMVALARRNAAVLGVHNARFVLGDLEALPLPDGFADVVVSNCVLNLVPDKPRAFREAYRVLKPGGRLVVSDVVAAGPLPPHLAEDPQAWSACVAGAPPREEYLQLLETAGFQDVEVLEVADAGCGDPWAVPVQSVTVRARKPA